MYSLKCLRNSYQLITHNRNTNYSLFHKVFTIIAISSLLTITTSPSYSNPDESLIPSINSPYDISLQYQVRDELGSLVCVVQSNDINYYDSTSTQNYLDKHPNRETIKRNGQMLNSILIHDAWTISDTGFSEESWLSSPKHAVVDESTGEITVYFQSITDACALTPGDMVITHWKIYYTSE